MFPDGASSRNAGFACFGSLSELVDDVTSMGMEGMKRLVQRRWRGLHLLRERLGDKALEFEQNGGYELVNHGDGFLDQLSTINTTLYPIFNQDVFKERQELIAAFNFQKQHVQTIVENPLEGQLNSGEMMKALMRHVSSLGAQLMSGVEMMAMDETEKGVKVYVKSGSTSYQLFANKVAICTNAFSKELLPDVELQAGRGLVLVTRPIQDLKIKGTFHIDRGYYYFRNVGDRLLLGGGRNLDFEGEKTTELGVNEKIEKELKDRLTHQLLPGKSFEIDYCWSGIMAFGPSKEPLVKKRSDRSFIGIRLGGMGVALGSEVGETLADLMLE